MPIGFVTSRVDVGLPSGVILDLFWAPWCRSTSHRRLSVLAGDSPSYRRARMGEVAAPQALRSEGGVGDGGSVMYISHELGPAERHGPLLDRRLRHQKGGVVGRGVRRSMRKRKTRQNPVAVGTHCRSSVRLSCAPSRPSSRSWRRCRRKISSRRPRRSRRSRRRGSRTSRRRRRGRARRRMRCVEVGFSRGGC